MSQEAERHPPSLILVSTGDALSQRQADIDRMMASVEAFKNRRPNVAVRLFFLLQRCDEAAARRAAAHVPAWVDLHIIPRRVSAAHARNMMLGPHAAGAVLRDGDVVGFPDDDCWYPDGLLDRIYNAFDGQDELDFWFCRYASNPAPADSGRETPPRLQDAIARGACNTIFLRGGLIRRIGYFDERLGLGSEIDGGEDTDLSVRAYYAARRSLFLDVPVIGHRDFRPDLKGRYFTGGFVVLARHAHRSPAGIFAGVRKLAVGAVYLGTGKLKPPQFLRALRLATIANRPAVPDFSGKPEFTRAPGR